MTQEQKLADILEKNIKGINLKVLWTIIFSTAVSVATVLSVYYNVKTEQEIMKLRLTLFEHRLEVLEKQKEGE